MNTKNFWDAVNDLSPKLFKTYATIHKLSDNEAGYCFATNEGLSKKMQKHKDNISRDISELIKLEYLYSIEMKDGFITTERRLYTAENLKTFLIDSKNIDNLYKTYAVVEKDIVYCYNERKPHPDWHKTVKITNDENVNGANDENVNGANDENVKVIITNNNLSKSKSGELDSDLENKFKTKPNVIKMLAFDRNLLLDQKFINSLRIYDIDFLKELFAKVPKGTTNPTGYLMTCLKNNPQPIASKTKKEVVKVPKVEEPKEKESRETLIANFCKESNCQIESIPTFLKNILNKTLEGMNYEQIS